MKANEFVSTYLYDRKIFEDGVILVPCSDDLKTCDDLVNYLIGRVHDAMREADISFNRTPNQDPHPTEEILRLLDGRKVLIMIHTYKGGLFDGQKKLDEFCHLLKRMLCELDHLRVLLSGPIELDVEHISH